MIGTKSLLQNRNASITNRNELTIVTYVSSPTHFGITNIGQKRGRLLNAHHKNWLVQNGTEPSSKEPTAAHFTPSAEPLAHTWSNDNHLLNTTCYSQTRLCHVKIESGMSFWLRIFLKMAHNNDKRNIGFMKKCY